ncbi:MAG: MliC family protein [Silvibacterium sp.]
MKALPKPIAVAVGILASTALAAATDVTIHLKGSEPVARSTIRYQCDGQGPKMGLPATTFAVEYINGAGNSLAILPVNGISLVFANVISGSGARYAAGQYIWWDAAGRSVSFSSDSLSGKMRSECHRVEMK